MLKSINIPRYNIHLCDFNGDLFDTVANVREHPREARNTTATVPGAAAVYRQQRTVQYSERGSSMGHHSESRFVGNYRSRYRFQSPRQIPAFPSPNEWFAILNGINNQVIDRIQI